jgi:PhoH-like ATPase
VEQDLRTYVLDTSVLLSDPRAFFRFAEHSVVVPVVVITELEGKRHDPELGYFARQALRHLDELRVEHGRLDFPVPVGEGGTLRVELANTDASVLPQGLRLSDNDTRILAVAMHLAQDGQEVTVVSKDLPMRVKAASLGINAEEYLAEQAVDSGWTGIADLHLSGDDISDLYEAEVASSDEVRGLP